MIDYTIDQTNRLIRVWMSGTNRCSDLAAHYSRVLKDPQYDRTLDSLFQVDGETTGPVMTELPEVKTLIEMLAQCQGATKWAVVMPLGFKRTVVEFLLKGTNLRSVTMQFFATESDAIAWLNVGKTSPIPPSDRGSTPTTSPVTPSESQMPHT